MTVYTDVAHVRIIHYITKTCLAKVCQMSSDSTHIFSSDSFHKKISVYSTVDEICADLYVLNYGVKFTLEIHIITI